MEAQTVLCCSGRLKEIHLLLLFTKFASQLRPELLNATVAYERREEGGSCRGKKGGLCREKEGGLGKEWKSFPAFSDIAT